MFAKRFVYVCLGAVILAAALGAMPGLVDGPLLTARFDLPTGVKFGPDGTLFITDTTNGAIRAVGAAAKSDRSTWGRLKGLYHQ